MFPGIEQLGFGGLAGAIAGYAAKKLAKATAVLLGVLFILLQLLAYYHFVEIRWGQIGEAAKELAGPSGSVASTFWKIVSHNLPFGGAFVVGFWIGFKKG